MGKAKYQGVVDLDWITRLDQTNARRVRLSAPFVQVNVLRIYFYNTDDYSTPNSSCPRQNSIPYTSNWSGLSLHNRQT